MPDLGGQVAQRQLDDAVGIIGRRAPAVLNRRDAEDDEPADARRDRLGGRLPQDLLGLGCDQDLASLVVV
jgi:hypothetical protein